MVSESISKALMVKLKLIAGVLPSLTKEKKSQNLKDEVTDRLVVHYKKLKRVFSIMPKPNYIKATIT